MSHRLSDAQAKWDRLTAADYARTKTARDLAAVLTERYGLSPERAERDVDIWLKETGLAPRRP